MPFKTTDYLLFQKRKPLDGELLTNFNAWLTTKSFSFYENGKLVDYINNTLNIYGNIFPTKEDQFKFFENIIPIQNRKKIIYLKKPKQLEKKENVPVPEFYSKREIDILEITSKYIHE
jgi:hypothetical protein